MAPLLAPLLLLSALATCLASEDGGPYAPLSDAARAVLGDVGSFADLRPCGATSAELAKYGPDDVLAPCLLYDIRDYDPGSDDGESLRRRRDEARDGEAYDGRVDSDSTTSQRDSARSLSSEGVAEVALVQVTPSNCNNHRDGAATSVKLLNSSNGGKGFEVGYRSLAGVAANVLTGMFNTSGGGGDRSVKLRLVSIVGGNPANVGNDVFTEVHVFLLDSALRQVENAAFILGSCSFASSADKPVALENRKIVLSQVGPPGFYDPAANPYVFGIHVNSDTYPLPALSALAFKLQAEGRPASSQQVRALYRDRSEFFKSTCESAVDAARERGFDVTAIEYNPDGDDDGDGTPNSQDEDHVRALADELCPPVNGYNSRQAYPAVFACVNQEVDVVLGRMRENGCRPVSAWFTTATWGWATANPGTVPYFQGGGQWHENFKYGDEFFETGQVSRESTRRVGREGWLDISRADSFLFLADSYTLLSVCLSFRCLFTRTDVLTDFVDPILPITFIPCVRRTPRVFFRFNRPTLIHPLALRARWLADLFDALNPRRMMKKQNNRPSWITDSRSTATSATTTTSSRTPCRCSWRSSCSPTSASRTAPTSPRRSGTATTRLSGVTS